jgi:hypothetical protein
MLSGAALQNKLSNSIHVFATTEAIGELTTLDALNKLIELYPTYPDPARDNQGQALPNPAPEVYANTEEKRLELLRRRLRNILAAETLATTLLCDKAFELQVLLARGFPVNNADIITLDEFQKNDKLIFLSSGTVFEKASAENFFNKALSRDGDGRYIDLNRDRLSDRELASLAEQGLERFSSLIDEEIRSTYYGRGKKIGRILGSVIAISLFAFLLVSSTVLFPPLLTLPLCVIAACALFASSDSEPSNLMRMYGAGAGVAIFAALVSLIFPPVMALFAASALISSSAAAAAVSFVGTVGVSFIMPALMIGAALARRILFPDITFYDALFKITNFPHVVIKKVCSTIGGLIGKGIQHITDYFNPPPAPQPVELLMPANNAETVVVNNNSNVLINISLGIDSPSPRREIMSLDAPQVEPEEKDTPHYEKGFVDVLGDNPIDVLCGNAFTMMRHA